MLCSAATGRTQEPDLQNSSNHTRQILAHLPLFQALSDTQIDSVAAGAKERRLDRGTPLFRRGDAAQGFYVVVFGRIKLALPSATGNEKVVEIIGPRQSFGEAVMFLDRAYPVNAEALEDSLLLHVSSETVTSLLSDDPSFARRMLAGLSLRLHSLIQDVESYSLRSSTQRVIGYLLQHCPDEENGPDEASVELPTAKQVVASRLNLTPETLSRVFHELGRSGLIVVQGRMVNIPSVKRLREFEI